MNYDNPIAILSFALVGLALLSRGARYALIAYSHSRTDAGDRFRNAESIGRSADVMLAGPDDPEQDQENL